MADFNGADADDMPNGTGEGDRLSGGGGADTAVFETGRSGFVVTSPLPAVLVVSEASGLSAGNGTDVLSGVETLAFASNVLRADEALRAFAPPAAGDGPEPEAPAAYGDGLQAVHDSSGLSWEEIAARVQANFEATGHWCF